MEIPPDYLAKQNPHERDSYIEFYPIPHIYTVKGEGGYTSVTTWNSRHFDHFDADKTVEKIMRGNNIKKPTYKYYGMTAEEIKAQWDKKRDEASSAGTKMHYDIECYWNQMEVHNDSVEFQYFLRFVDDFKRDNPGVEPYRTEWMVFWEEYKIAGSIDMVFVNPDGSLQIYDWKRCEEIECEDRFGKTATTEGIQHLPDTNFWHYALQLNVYKTILEKKYEKTVSKLCLVCLHPNNPYKTYTQIPVPILEKEMSTVFALRKQELETPDK
jgi:ATP-dependent exoDNAse (exonuclease V) beta subunit